MIALLVPLGLGLGAACAALSPDDIYAIARRAGFPSDVAVTMTAIAERESSGCPSAYNGGNPPGAEQSYGLWQINVKGNPTIVQRIGAGSSQALFDPDVNARAAFLLWGGNNANLNTAWYINRPGYKEAYEQYLPLAQQAAARVDGGAGPIYAATGASDAPPGDDIDAMLPLALVAGLGVLALVLVA